MQHADAFDGVARYKEPEHVLTVVSRFCGFRILRTVLLPLVPPDSII